MAATVYQAVVAVGGSFTLSVIVKATVVAALALIGTRMARQSPASLRHLLLAAAFIVLLGLPVGSWIAPPIQLNILLPPGVPASVPVTSAPQGPAIALNSPAVPSSQAISDGPTRALSIAIAAIWTGGTIVCLLPLVAGLWQLRRIRRVSPTWLDADKPLQELASDMGIPRKVAVLRSDLIPGPITCGVVRCAILFPRDALSWSDGAVRRAMVHELEHVRRRDGLMQIVARFVCALYWFHPLVWACGRRLGLEAERACDDAVLSRADAVEYADQLLTLAERITTDTKVPLPAMVKRGDLPVRIAAVLDARQRRGRSGTGPVLAALSSAALLTAIISPMLAVSAIRTREPGQALTFEVASIKPNKAGDLVGSGFGIFPGGRLTSRNTTLEDLVWFAHGDGHSREGLISGGPDWVRSDRFDIEAKAAEAANPNQLKSMLGSLLADRFRLRIHEETRQLPVYELVLARPEGTLGSKLRRTPSAEVAHCASFEATPPAAPEFFDDGTKRCSTTFRAGVKMRGRPVSDLTEALSELLERPVIDKTGLEGRFDADVDVTLNWDHLVGAGPADTVGTNAVIFRALQDLLGLKLESARGAVRTIVIDSAQKPTEN